MKLLKQSKQQLPNGWWDGLQLSHSCGVEFQLERDDNVWVSQYDVWCVKCPGCKQPLELPVQQPEIMGMI